MEHTARTYSVIVIGGEGDPAAAPTLPLVAALLALDIPAEKSCPFVEYVELTGESTEPTPGECEGEPVLKRSHKWILREGSTCGRYKAAKLREWWEDWSWLDEHREHPLAAIRAAFHAAGVALLPESEPPAPGEPLPRPLVRFRAFAEQSPLADHWHNQAHRRAHPGALASAGDAFALLPLLRAELEKSVPLMTVRKGLRRAFIPIDASPEEEAEILARLEKKK